MKHHLTKHQNHSIMKFMLGFHTRSLIITIVLVILAALGGFLGGALSGNQTSEAGKGGAAKAGKNDKLSPLFDSQTATINGEIEKAENFKVEIKKKGLTESFALSPQFIIYKYATSSAQPTTFTNTTDIELGKTANVMLEKVGGEYKIISISYFGFFQSL